MIRSVLGSRASIGGVLGSGRGGGNGLLTGLVAYWGLDEASGANNALDKHGGGLTLTQYNSPGADTGQVYSTAGTAGQALTASGSASDPLLNTVPGAYASGTAGHALGRIANGQLTIVQPVLDDGFFRIVPGRDYLADDGMAFTFSSTSWPTLADGTTVEFIFGEKTLDGERTGDQTVRLEVTAAQGETLAAARSGRQHYDMVATLPSGSVVGLAENAPVLVG